jgi:hypothetical protein
MNWTDFLWGVHVGLWTMHLMRTLADWLFPKIERPRAKQPKEEKENTEK